MNIYPKEWGWIFKNNILEPVTTLLTPIQDELLSIIFYVVMLCWNAVTDMTEDTNDFDMYIDINPINMIFKYTRNSKWYKQLNII